MADLSVGSTLAGCRLDAVAGRGGMGVVYRATQLALDRPVALKAMAPQLAEDLGYRERFQRESHLAASIDHPNVIPVYEAGELDGTLYLIMRWVDGTDLRELLSSSGRLSPARAVRLLRPVASALSAAHRRGLVHRDIKPANVLLARGEDDEGEHVYLTDFGIARRTTGERAVTRTGVLVGTLDYTAPERIEGGTGTPASDIYAFGCMLFEVLTGHVPFERPTELMMMHAHLNDPVPSVRDEVPGVPERLDQIVARAMAKRPEDRFASAAELASALARALEEAQTGEVEFRRRLERAELPTDETEVERVEPTRTDPPPTAPRTGVEPPAVGAPEPEPAEPATVIHDPSAAMPPPPRPRRRSPWVLAAPVALIAAAGIAIALLSSGGGAGKPTTSSSTVADTTATSRTSTSTSTSRSASVAPPTVSGQPVKSIKAISLPAGSDPGALWAEGPSVLAVTSHGVLRVGGNGAHFAAGGHPVDVAEDAGGRVWVTETGPSAVLVFNADGKQLTKIPLGFTPSALAIHGQEAWIAAAGSRSITRVGPSFVTSTVTAPNPVGAMGEAYGRLWVASADGSLSALNGQGHPTLPAPTVPPRTIAIGHSDGVWFVNRAGTLTRVDPRTNPSLLVNGRYHEHANQYSVGDHPIPDIASLEKQHSIWVGSLSHRTVIRLQTNGPNNNSPSTTIQFHAEPAHIAVDPSYLWVAVPSQDRIYRISY